MRLLNINAQSIVNKTVELESILLTYAPHITVLTETWLSDNHSDEDIVPENYKIIRRDRPYRGGGVAVVLNTRTTSILLDQIEDHESLCLQLNVFGNTIILIAVYRPPSSEVEFLTKLYDYLLKHSKNHLIIAGDFNLPNINWGKLCSPCFSDQVVFDIMLACDLDQAVGTPTRVQGNAASILDLVFHSKSFSNIYVSLEDGLSDHKLVLFTCSVVDLSDQVPLQRKMFKDFSRANDESILDYLDLSFDGFSGNDANYLWKKFRSLCEFCLENFIPNKAKTSNHRNPWITREIIHLTRKVKKAKRRQPKGPLLQKLKDSLANNIRAAKRHYFSVTLPQFLKSDPAKFWRKLQPNKQKSVECVKLGDEIIRDSKEIASEFNRYFHSVFSDPSVCANSNDNCIKVDPDFITFEGVFSMLLNIKSKSSCGPDNIPNAFLRRYAESIARFLVVIFRSSLSQGIVPKDWLIARVVPVFKKGDNAIVTNYRPISLTVSCCKLMEHIISNYILNFLDERNILSPFQHGFRKGLSTTTQLITSIHSFSAVIDKSGQTDVVFIDFSKAFDRISHSKLIFKLNLLGLPSTIVNWIKSYLHSRVQFVDINGSHSDFLPVNSGVPQGSVLGPLLFLIYINDVVSCVKEGVEIRLFADDCLLSSTINSSNDQQILNDSLDAINNWCDLWDMKLNTEKTVFMRITNKKQPHEHQYTINGLPISRTDSFKYLGVTITSNLTWSSHILKVCASARRKLGLLRHKLKNSPANIKLLAYTSIVRPCLEYACVVWDPHTKKDIDNLEKIQRLAVRFIYNRYRRHDSPTELMKINKIPTLESRRKMNRLKFLFQLSHGNIRLETSAFLTPLSSRPTRNYHSAKFTPITARTNNFKYSFFPRTITDWNNLPHEILSSENVLKSIDQMFGL